MALSNYNPSTQTFTLFGPAVSADDLQQALLDSRSLAAPAGAGKLLGGTGTAGTAVAITLGSNLTLSGNVLNASGSGGGGTTYTATAPVSISGSIISLAQSGATTGQALAWSGSAWVPTTISGSGGSYTLPVATGSVLGGVKQGSGVTIAGDGTLSASGGGGSYTLPAASTTVLGGVKQGSGTTIAGDGTISVSAGTAYTFGTGLTNTSGTITVSFGTTSTTAAAGNDSRITGAIPKVGSATAGHIAVLASDGSLTDSGQSLTTSTPSSLSAAVQGTAYITVAYDSSNNPVKVTGGLDTIPAFGFSGVPGAAQRQIYNVVRAFALPTGLAGSLATSLVAATASAVFTLSYVRAGTTTAIATITFSAAGKTGAFSGVTIPTLAVGDILLLTAPSTADATLADIGVSILGGKL